MLKIQCVVEEFKEDGGCLFILCGCVAGYQHKTVVIVIQKMRRRMETWKNDDG
jgi:hypothetical protein